jgi:hypothetical protein
MSLLLSRSITTLSGPDLDKAKIITYEFVMTGTDYAYGMVEFDEGITVSGGGISPIGIDGSIKKQIRFLAEKEIDLAQNLHFDGFRGSFLLDMSLANDECSIRGPSQPLYILYLDSDVTVSSGDQIRRKQNILLENIIIDGQGHTIDFANSLHCGFILGVNVTLKNMMLKNVWYQLDPITFESRGNFQLLTLAGNTTFDNVQFLARKFQPLEFVLSGITGPGFDFRRKLSIKNNVLWGNYGQYAIWSFGWGYPANSMFIIDNNSNLIVQDSSLIFNRYYDSDLTKPKAPLQVVFQSNTSFLTIDNSIVGLTNDNVFPDGSDHPFETDLTLTLSVGTINVKGNSTLQADSLLARNGKATLKIGDGVSAASDMNIIINPGATLNLVSTNTNCSVKLQNVH